MTRVAVVQAASVPFDPGAAVAKADALLASVAAGGAELAVFPEAFVGCYPKGTGFGAVVGRRTGEGRELYHRYFRASVALEGPEVAALTAAAARHGVFVVLGVVERLGATLYCTVLMIDPSAGLLAIHRKLMPTGTERLIWGFGDGSTIRTVQSPAGRLGAVVCWENYMPALRQAMYAQGIELYCAPTADDRPTWVPSMQHIALEGRVFVLTACQAIRVGDYPDWYVEELGEESAAYLMRGGSAIVAPDGAVLAGPVFDEETILYADIDLAEITRGHLDMDAVGHYSRPDVFELRVDTRERSPVAFDQAQPPSRTLLRPVPGSPAPRGCRGATRRTAVAVRHVEFEDLGILAPLLAEQGFETSYLEATTHDARWSRADDADLLIVLGGPVGVADALTYPFLHVELEIIRRRLAAERPTLGICLGAQLLAAAAGGEVQPGAAAEIGYAPVMLTELGRGSLLRALEGVPVLHWHGDVISLPAGVPSLASTPACEAQAFALGPNALGLQFHLEADVASLERWLVGHAHELAARDIDVEKLRDDAAAHGPRLRDSATSIFSTWLSELKPAASDGAGSPPLPEPL